MTQVRKAFVVSVMFVTVLAMSLVVAPQVDAAAQAGDLIKMNGLSSVYYLGADGKRYVFPNENTYFSWFSDFSGVVTIPQSELETYPLGKNISVRPGTYLVKITTDPKVYAVEPGANLVHVTNETVASTLWGANWAQRVVDVPDSFFVNYHVSGSQVSASAYPAGSLVKWAGAADVYVVNEDDTASKIASEAAFNANKFRWEFVVTAPASVSMPSAGAAVTGKETRFTDLTLGAAGVAGAGTGLTAALAGDTPASQTLPSGASQIPFLVFNLTASSDGEVTVNGLTFTRSGVGVVGDIDGAYLFAGDERISTKRTINTSDNTVTFTALGLKVPAGQSKAVSLKIDADPAANSNHYFKIAKASDIVTNGATVSGSFPISGNTMSFSNSVDAATVTITGEAGSNATRIIGEKDVILGEFTIENNDKEDVNINRIKVKNDGTASDEAVSGLDLYLDGELVATDADLVNDYVDFILDDSFLLEKSEEITATIKGDVVSDINKTVEFILKSDADVEIKGAAYGDFYSALIVNDFDGGDIINIDGSELNVSFDGPAAADVKAGTDNMILANLKIKAEEQDVNIEKLTVDVAMSTAGDPAGCVLADVLENPEIVDTITGDSYSSDAITAEDGPMVFEDVTIIAGQQYNFAIRGDVPEDATQGCIYQASINFASAAGKFTAEFSAEGVDVEDSNISSLTLSGKNMTVAEPIVWFDPVTTADKTVVRNAKNVLLFKGKITANSVDNVKVTKVSVDADTDFEGDYNKLYFYKINKDGTESLLDTETSLAVDMVSFTGYTLDITKGLSNGTYVAVRGDVKDTPAASTIDLNWNGTDSNYIVKDTDNNRVDGGNLIEDSAVGHTTTVVTEGEWSLEFDNESAGVNQNKNALAGTIVLLGKLKGNAQKENAILEDLALELTGSADNTDLATIYLYSDVEMKNELANVDVNADGFAQFEDLNIEIVAGTAKNIYVGGLVKGVDYSTDPATDSTAVAGNIVSLAITTGAPYVVEATGKNTSEVLDNTDVDVVTETNEATVMGAVISGLTTTFPSADLTALGVTDLFSFKVTVPASANKDWENGALGAMLEDIKFNLAISAGLTLDDFMIERVDADGVNGEQDAEQGGFDQNAADFTIDFATVFEDLADGIVRPGDTAEYVIKATVGGDVVGESVKVTIEDVDTNVDYMHTTVDGDTFTTSVAPLINGVSYVRGGGLTTKN